MEDRTRTTTSWYADNHLEEVDDAWTMDDPDAYRQAMPWRPQSAILAQVDREQREARERLARARAEAAAEEEVLAAAEAGEEFAEELITEVEGLMAAEIFDDELVAVEELEEELTDEEVIDLASALASDIRDALAADLGEDALSPLDEPTIVEAVELRSVDLEPLQGEAFDEPTMPTDAVLLVPAYSVQCEPAANVLTDDVLDRATPARIVRRLWQRDIDRIAG